MATTGRRSPALRLGLGLLVVAGLAAIARAPSVEARLPGLLAAIRSAGWLGVLAFGTAYVLACVLVLPGAILTLGAGFVYGVAVGTPVVWVAANAGAVLAFLLGRTVARGWITRRLAGNPRFAALDRAVGGAGFRIVLLTRLSPVLPFNLLNYAFGLTRVRLGDYVAGSMIGMLPGTLLYVYLGSLATSAGDLAAGRTGGPLEEAVYFGGLVATVAAALTVARVARRALAAAAAAPARLPGSPGGGPHVLPDDEHDRALLGHVRPPQWRNPAPAGRYDLVVVGGGTAGLVAAAGAASLGARVALVEEHLLGGDCLNAGCVPSKALLAAARAAAAARSAGRFGVRTGPVTVDFPAVMARMRRLRAAIAPADGAARLARLGVDVHFGRGRFTSPGTLAVDGRALAFARAVVATGTRAAVPDVPGLAAAGYLTNETLFALTALPRRLVVVGAGPIGCEMAQAFRRFGADVTLLEAGPRILPRDDPDAAAVVERALRADGVVVALGARIERVAARAGEAVVHFQGDAGPDAVACDRILIAVGRAPNVEDLGLDAAGVDAGPAGIRVDDRLRTTNRRIWAAGDVAAPYRFTHTADALARLAVQNALFLGRKRASALVVPWCTYTAPELAHTGLTAEEAARRGIPITTVTIPLAEVDRARLDGAEAGFLRVHLRRGGDRVVGATLVAEHAGEVISELTLALRAGLGLRAVGATIHPYPTAAEALRKAADAWNRARVTPRVRRVLGWWLAARR
ncbi:MAG TPA: FAD-containing oxidoreductase [Candidatus Binatia bacterium]|nr:FAD-containing oxidoreductase [Candidatus Binatia bacterium]